MTLALEKQSLRLAAWAVGLSVSALARKIGRSRMSVYRAWAAPDRHPRIAKEIQKALR